MADRLHLQLVSPERMLVEEDVDEVQVPALDGLIGVLPGHAPLLSELKRGGVLTYRNGGQEKVFVVFGGFVEVLPDRVRVLADSAHPQTEIDIAAARKELEDAMRAAGELHGMADPAVALAEMERAQANLEAAERK